MLAPVGLVIAGLSLVLNVVGMAIPYWLYLSSLGVTIKIGLWQLCTTSDSIDTCVMYENIDGNLQATRALEVMAVLALATAVTCLFLKLLVMKQLTALRKVGTTLAIISGTLGITGCVIFAVKLKKVSNIQGVDLHAGFALCIVSAVGAYVSAGLTSLSARQS